MNGYGNDNRYSPQSRAERLIATSRMVLAGFFLLAIWLDPFEPSRYTTITYAILAFYFGYAIVLAAVIWRSPVPLGNALIVTHALDLLIFAIIMFFTKGSTSPFFVYFVFLLVCAALRWQWTGTLWTAAAALIAVIAMAIYPADFLSDSSFELNRLIIRLVYLAVVAIMLGYLGAHEHRLRGEITKLAAWPRLATDRANSMVGEMLAHTAAILGAPRIILAWEEEEEPWLHLAFCSDGDYHYARESPAAFGSMVAEPLAEVGFFCRDLRRSDSQVVYDASNGPRRWKGAPLQEELRTRFTPKAVLSLPLVGKNLKGYLMAFDKSRMTLDDLVLGRIIANEVGTRLDHFYFVKQLQQTAVAAERIRLARDLHDGLLQSLTGAALQLETVQRLMKSDPEAAGKLLREAQDLIVAEQRDLRYHIQELKPTVQGLRQKDADLAARLSELADRIWRHWRLTVEMNLSVPGGWIQKDLAQEIYFLVHESLINAARHARATKAGVDLAVKNDRVMIVVNDNGKGFPFKGHYDHAALAAMNQGPVTLLERVGALGGSLEIDSSETGTQLDISVPLAEKGGCHGHPFAPRR